MKIKLVLKCRPISKDNIKTISRSGTAHYYLPKKYKDFEQDLAWQIRVQYKGRQLEGKLRINYLRFYYDYRPTIVDLLNAPKSVMDAVEKSGIIYNDNQIWEVNNMAKFQDKTNPRIEMEIEEV